jgi:hypothetical protein
MLKKLLLTLALAGSLFAQHDASINLNSDELELKGNLDLGELMQSDYPDMYFITMGYLDVDNDESTDPLLEVGFMLRDDIYAVDGLRFGIGFKGNTAEVSGQNFSSIPLGVELEYTLPIDFSMPITLSGVLFYAPPALTFQDGDKYLETRIEASIAIVEQAIIFVGYRQIDTDYDGWVGDYSYSDEAYVGFRIRF